MKTLGIVEVRRDAGRNWGIDRRLGGKSILEWIVRRATDCQRLDAVVVLCGDACEKAVRALVPPDVELLHAAKTDSLGAAAAVCERLNAESLVHLCADNPFVDPVLVDRLVADADSHPHCDYIGYCRADGRPAILTHLGVFAEWCSAKALSRAARLAKHPLHRENLTAYLYSHPEQFNVRLVPLPSELDREDLRLRIDGEQDWEHTLAIYEALDHEDCDWRRIADLLDHQPALRHQMAQLNRAHRSERGVSVRP